MKKFAHSQRFIHSEKPLRKTIKKRFLLLMVIGLTGVFMLFRDLNLVVTPSIKPTVLWFSDKAFQRGDYVTFTLIHPLANKGKPVPITKKLVCLPGDRLSISDVHYYCNGEYLGQVHRYSMALKKALPVFSYEGVIPENKGFVIGSNFQSFDSKNWGFITLSETKNNEVWF